MTWILVAVAVALALVVAGISAAFGSGPRPSPVPTGTGTATLRAAALVSQGARPLVPAAPPGWTIKAYTVDSAGLRRYYLLARPLDTPTAGLPIVVVLHGRNMTPAAIERRTGFLGVVGQALVVYPAGIDESWNAGYCCGGARRAGVNDVAFLEAAIRQVKAADSSAYAQKVYLVGYSNGGRMAFRMAYADAGAFSGVAAVEAVAVSTCDRHRSLPLLEVASTGDPLLAIRMAAPPSTSPATPSRR